ncbi:hypothetical protein EDB19DRAFT_1908242 [Suillus lakei]|nr:hypothetical protein EDB19DRAFT_1908242 [Suillus lakei]
MTQNLSLSSQTDTMVSVQLDGLIEFLQCLSLEDRDTLSRGLGIGADTSRATWMADDTIETPPTPSMASDSSPTNIEDPTPAPFESTPTAVAPTIPAAPAPTVAAPTGHTTVLVEFDEFNSSDDKGAAMAASALADDFLLHFYHGTYFNVPADADAQAPLYYLTRGQYISVFSGRDATGPKVLGISCAIYHKVDSVMKGISIVRGAIDRGDAVQVL